MSDNFLIGRILDNKYWIESLISQGGMGSVYSARRHIGDRVAVKILKIDEDLSSTNLKRFQLEAAAAASIKHQNVIAVYDFGLLDDIAYIVMERLEGPSLSDEIRDYGPFSLERAIRIFNQVCSAVSAAHKKGIIHRDLKPANIIFQYRNCIDELVKVVDFGLAKLMQTPDGERITDPSATIGTPAYMSPEQCMGNRVDEHSDIYSLGIVLYELLTGTLPFQEIPVSALLVQHVTKAPLSLSYVDPDIPEQVDRAVMKALEKNPEKRYRSAIEMATEFELACRSATLSKKMKSSPREDDSETDPSSNLFNPTLKISEPLLALPEQELATITNTANKRATGEFSSDQFSFNRFIGRYEEVE